MKKDARSEPEWSTVEVHQISWVVRRNIWSIQSRHLKSKTRRTARHSYEDHESKHCRHSLITYRREIHSKGQLRIDNPTPRTIMVFSMIVGGRDNSRTRLMKKINANNVIGKTNVLSANQTWGNGIEIRRSGMWQLRCQQKKKAIARAVRKGYTLENPRIHDNSRMTLWKCFRMQCARVIDCFIWENVGKIKQCT